MHKYFTGLLALTLAATPQAWAQRGGGFGGGAVIGGGAAGRTSATTRTYPNAGTFGDAYFSIDPESRRVVTIADEETSAAISNVLSNLDRPKPQVLLNCVFLQVTHNNASDIGFEGAWGKGLGQNTTATAANGFGVSPLSSVVGSNLNFLNQPISLFSSSSSATPLGAGLYSIAGQNYQATLRAIAASGTTKVLSRPSILARNNQPATIIVGQEVATITGVTYNTLNGSPTYGINWRQVGVILKVTPFITSEGLVEMIVQPEISSIDPTLTFPIAAGVNAPAIDIRSADTVVVTPDGQTVIIGGLMEKDKSVSNTKIPVLGDIPLLGNLFKRQQKSDAMTELIIFLTPHIVHMPSQLVALSDKERQKSDAPKAFTEQDLNRFLDTLPTKDVPPAQAPKADQKKPKAPKDAQ